jgi:chromosomal replication initiation ATPase DnaA
MGNLLDNLNKVKQIIVEDYSFEFGKPKIELNEYEFFIENLESESKKDVFKNLKEYIEHLNLHSDARNKEFKTIRHVAFYILRKYRKLSYPEIGALFNRDHATIIWGCRKAQDFIDVKDSYFISIYNKFEKPFKELPLY